jgi:hypothetical protein
VWRGILNSGTSVDPFDLEHWQVPGPIDVCARNAGVDRLYAAIDGRAVDALLANAGHGLGKGFLDQEHFSGCRQRIQSASIRSRSRCTQS